MSDVKQWRRIFGDDIAPDALQEETKYFCGVWKHSGDDVDLLGHSVRELARRRLGLSAVSRFLPSVLELQ